MQNLLRLVEEYEDVKERFDALDKARKDAWKDKERLSVDLAEYFRDNMITGKLPVGDIEIKAEFVSKFGITGGKLTAPENRKTVIDLLLECGVIDETKVKYFDGAEADERALQKAFKSLHPETIQKLKDDNLISIYDEPKVSIRAKKIQLA